MVFMRNYKMECAVRGETSFLLTNINGTPDLGLIESAVVKACEGLGDYEYEIKDYTQIKNGDYGFNYYDEHDAVVTIEIDDTAEYYVHYDSECGESSEYYGVSEDEFECIATDVRNWLGSDYDVDALDYHFEISEV